MTADFYKDINYMFNKFFYIKHRSCVIETIYLEKKEKRSESSLYLDISIGCQDTERLKISMAR